MSKFFLPEIAGDHRDRSVTMNLIKPEITNIDEAHNTITIEGLAAGADDSNNDYGTVVTIELLGNQLRIPRNIYNIRIIIEED